MSRRDFLATHCMPGKVKLHPSGHEFEVDADDSILEAALRYGLSVDYGCSNGSCGSCKMRLLTGEISKTRPHDFVLPEAEKIQGYFLACSNSNRGDIEVEATEAADAADIEKQNIVTRIKKVKPLNDHVTLLHLQTPRTQRLRFLAGQGAYLGVDDKPLGDLPIASCPCDDRNLEFHIRTNDGSALANKLPELQPNQPVELSGPVGEFVLDETSDRPVVFLAFDTGFAPVKSLIEHSMQLEHAERTHLYWIVDKNESHYMHNLARSWSDAFDHFHYVPISTGTDPAAMTRTVMDVVSHHPDINISDNYIAGNATFVEISGDALSRSNVPAQQIYNYVVH